MEEELMSDLYEKKAKQEKKIFFDKLKEKSWTLEKYIKRQTLIKNIFKTAFIIGMIDFISRVFMGRQEGGIIVYTLVQIFPVPAFVGIVICLLDMWLLWLMIFFVYKNKLKKIKDYQ